MLLRQVLQTMRATAIGKGPDSIGKRKSVPTPVLTKKPPASFQITSMPSEPSQRKHSTCPTLPQPQPLPPPLPSSLHPPLTLLPPPPLPLALRPAAHRRAGAAGDGVWAVDGEPSGAVLRHRRRAPGAAGDSDRVSGP